MIPTLLVLSSCLACTLLRCLCVLQAVCPSNSTHSPGMTRGLFLIVSIFDHVCYVSGLIMSLFMSFSNKSLPRDSHLGFYCHRLWWVRYFLVLWGYTCCMNCRYIGHSCGWKHFKLCSCHLQFDSGSGRTLLDCNNTHHLIGCTEISLDQN